MGNSESADEGEYMLDDEGGDGILSCCAARRGKAGKSRRGPGSICTYQTAGSCVQVAYTEWEEIIRLSCAITPGGKMLGLSSTKKMIVSLHRQPLRPRGSTKQARIQFWEIHKGARGLNRLSDRLNAGNEQPKRKARVAQPRLESVGKLVLSPDVSVGCIEFLDAANPRYLIVSCSSPPAQQRLVAILQDRYGQTQEEAKKVSKSLRETFKSDWQLTELLADEAKLEVELLCLNVVKMESNDTKSHGFKTPRGVQMKNPLFVKSAEPLSPFAKSSWNLVHALRIYKFQAGAGRNVENENEKWKLCLDTELHGHAQKITKVKSKRDLIVSCDCGGILKVWHWTNWKDTDWRRVSRKRNKKGTQPTEQEISLNFVCIHTIQAHAMYQSVSDMCTLQSTGKMHIFTIGDDGTIGAWEVTKSGINKLKFITSAQSGLISGTSICRVGPPDIGASWYAASHGFHAPASPGAKKKKSQARPQSLLTTPLTPRRSNANTSTCKLPTIVVAGVCTETGTNVIQVWDMDIAECRHQMEGHKGTVTKIGFGPYNNGPLFSCSEDGQIKIWSHTRGECQTTLNVGKHSMAWDAAIEPNAHVWTSVDQGSVVGWKFA